MFTRLSILLLFLAGLVLPAACSRSTDNEPPVATPSVSISRERAAIGSPLKITYKFEVAQGATIPGDYWVFLHVLDPEGERLWGDDHQPPVPTSTWKPGQTIEYTRTIFVPNYPYIGPADVRVGLYRPEGGNRLPLSGNQVGPREYEVAHFQLLPQSENIFLIYKEGWHPAEVSSDDPTTEWQWTQKAATVSFRNPKKDSTLYLEYDARTDRFSPPQQVTLRAGREVVGTFTADAKEKKLLTLPLTAAQLGSEDITEVTIELDRTFTPGGTDTRELGIRVFHVFIEPK